MQIEDLGTTQTWYMELQQPAGVDLPQVRLSPARRIARHLGLIKRSLPYLLGRRQACSEFRNVQLD